MLLKTILVLCALGLCKAKSKTIRATQYGPIRGRVLTSRANSSIEYYAFQGIPYAKPPLGNLRFKEPQPPQSWTKTKCAYRLRAPCMQFDPNNDTSVIGSEDCLYLSIFVPKTEANNLKQMPVMVWLHTGGWAGQSVITTGWDYFMEQPVIIVEIEYRLNVFGFFTTLDDNAKGNLGMKDQVQALKWLQNNIEYFGGDPSKVTLFGSTTGGVSATFHMFSPLSRGLFSGVISQTGNPILGGALQRNPLLYTRLLLDALSIDSTDNAEIVEQLQAIDAETLIRIALNYTVVEYITTSWGVQPYSIIIEIQSNTSFLTESPYDLLRWGKYAKVPLMIGFTSQPAEYCWAYYITSGRNDINEYQTSPETTLIPLKMNIPEGSPCLNSTLRNITNRYFPDGNYTNPSEWIHYYNNEEFIVGILESVSYFKSQIPVYFFYFSYVGSRNEALLRPRGVAVYEEVLYLAYPQNAPGANPNETAADRLTRQRMVTMWYNFAAKRNPTPEPEELLQNVAWPTLTTRQNYLNINSTLRVQSPVPNLPELRFWRKLYDDCGFPDPNPNRPPM